MPDVADDLKAVLTAIDADANLLAQNVAALLARVKNTLTDQEVAEIKSIGGAIEARLKQLGADTANPVPPPNPQLVAARKKL